MASRAKFLFDNDCAVGTRGNKPMISLAEHAEKVALAEAAAHARGFAEAETKAEQRAAVALERVAGLLQGLDRSLAAVEARLETEAVEVAGGGGRELGPPPLGPGAPAGKLAPPPPRPFPPVPSPPPP